MTGADGDGLMDERVLDDRAVCTPGCAVVLGKIGAATGPRPSICSFICLLSQLITDRRRELVSNEYKRSYIREYSEC